MNNASLLALTTAWAVLSSFPLIARPQEPQIISGEARIQTEQGCLKVTTSHQAIIHWKDFSIAEGESVRG